MALQAGASGLTFTPVPGLIGSDLMRVRGDFRVIADPYDEMSVAVVPAITPDIALVHALRADPEGNLVVGSKGDDPLLIQASRFVIATCEEFVEEPITTLGADERLVPGIYVDVLSLAPQGSHPLDCQGRYDEDTAHIRRYLDASKNRDAFAAYLHEFVFEPEGYDAYLERVLQPAAV